MLLPETLMGMLRHQMHVLHQFLRLGEHGLVDALNDDLVFIEDGAEDGDVRVIDSSPPAHHPYLQALKGRLPTPCFSPVQKTSLV